MEVHVFNPDHNLFCQDCGHGELTGNHGIIAIENGIQMYENDEVAELYEATDIEWYHHA